MGVCAKGWEAPYVIWALLQDLVAAASGRVTRDLAANLSNSVHSWGAEREALVMASLEMWSWGGERPHTTHDVDSKWFGSCG